jgi:hypothetical protein
MSAMLSTNLLFAQNTRVPIKLWGLQSFGGVIGVEGEYQTKDINLRSSYSDNLKSSIFRGRLGLNTQSYFYHPNLISLETEMEYNPGTQKDKYLVIPDRSDVTTGERARGIITVLRTQPVIVTGNASIAHIFTNREYATNVETYNTSFGVGISYKNNFAPIGISFQKEKIDQKELRTERQYLTRRNNFKANSSLSISEYDKNRITYTFDDYERQYFSSAVVKSQISSIHLNSNIHFDSTNANSLNSNIFYSSNSGNFNYNRFQVNENLNLKLINSLFYSGNYHFFNFDQQLTNLKQHTVRNRLEHQLYKSLRTHIYYEYINTDQTFFNEQTYTAGIGLSYSKKIPTGNFSLSYNFRKRNLDNENLAPALFFIDESHRLADDEIVLLNNPFVEITSILVKDETGTINYQNNLDYIIVERNNFIEIQRLPGGLIENGTAIYVDYRSIGQPSFEYSVNSNNFSTRLTLFQNLFEIYFRLNENSYSNIKGREASILKSLSQRVYGTKISINPITAGIEFDDFNSNIIPYESTRYFLTVAGRVSSRLNTSLTANLKFIELLDENEKQEFHDIAGRIVYGISSSTNFNLEASYRFQEGKGLDLDLAILRGEIKTQFRAIYITIGFEGYNRKYISEKINYWGSFIRIERKF